VYRATFLTCCNKWEIKGVTVGCIFLNFTYDVHVTAIRSNHKLRQTEIPPTVNSRLQTHSLSNCCVHKKNCLSVYFYENVTCWVLVCWGSVRFLPSPVKLCVGGLRQMTVMTAMLLHLQRCCDRSRVMITKPGLVDWQPVGGPHNTRIGAAGD
jgi:hypothetical protein